MQVSLGLPTHRVDAGADLLPAIERFGTDVLPTIRATPPAGR